MSIYLWLAALLLGPVAAVAAAQLLVEGRLRNRITANGWTGLGAYFLAGQLARSLFGVTVWSMVAGLGAAIVTGLVLRAVAMREKRRHGDRGSP